MIQFSVFNIIVSLILLCSTVRNAEDTEELVNLSSSLESSSDEKYNVSSKERPIKRIVGNIADSTSKHIASDSEDNGNSRDIFLENKSSDIEVASIETIQRRPPPVVSSSKFSFTVSIQKRASHYASGALVHKMWILSVAEPFYNVRESIKLYKARVGSIHAKKGGILLHLNGIEIHPQYEYRKSNFDLALLRIAESKMDVTKRITPASLPMMKEDDLNNMVWATYWPRLIVNGKVLSSSANERYQQNVMRVSYQQPILWNSCKKFLEKRNVTLDNSSICLEPIKTYHSRCMPDPGAPIVADDYLLGITSGWTSEDCLNRTSPTLVTRVFSLRILSWINNFLHVSETREDKL